MKPSMEAHIEPRGGEDISGIIAICRNRVDIFESLGGNIEGAQSSLVQRWIDRRSRAALSPSEYQMLADELQVLCREIYKKFRREK